MSDRAEPQRRSGGFQPPRGNLRRLEATATGPKLLVSVRSVTEARAALTGGADIIDVKEPRHGSLGRADVEVLHAVASLPGIAALEIPFSAALGEVHETCHQRHINLPLHVTFAKLGLAHLHNDPNWVARWVKVRRSFTAQARSPLGWIGVIYADADAAQAPPAPEIIHAAVSTGCVGLLVDTFCKTSGRLLDYVTPAELAKWARMGRSRGLMFAVAGSLVPQDLRHFVTVSADVIAVRSAVCVGGDRSAAVCADAVAEFKRAVCDMPIRTGGISKLS